jgi:hypothetical protein
MRDPVPGDSRQAVQWLLLIHQLPAKPAYARVKLWRRLQAIGAVAVKNAVYALPASESTQEDFDWLLKEILEVGGEGLLCEARLIDGLSDHEVQDRFNAARAADYAELAGDIRAQTAAFAEGTAPGDQAAQVRRWQTRAAQIGAIDFFGAEGRETVVALLAALQERADMVHAVEDAGAGGTDLRNRVWVTRQGVHVDRMASAWLIRRFIDASARFKFVLAKGYQPLEGELRYDMFEAEFTHEGDRCTFEVLLARTGLNDPALAVIAEIVHDIDLKDGKFGRPEVSGVAQLIAGIAAATADDEERVARGAMLFDALYGSFSRGRTPVCCR